MTIRYAITPRHPEAHLFEVSCTVPDPDPQGQRFALPAWAPGSYLIREFAKHVVSIRAESGGKAVPLRKLDKHTWIAAPVSRALTVTAEVYAWDLSVRGAHLDTSHGFFNGTSVFLRVLGREPERCEVDIRPAVGRRYRDWRVATALRTLKARPYGFGTYWAAEYDELVDHPVEMGEFSLAAFEAGGVPHEVVITGRHDTDLERLARDLARICETQIRFWHGPAAGRAGAPKPPMDRYAFLVTALGDGYGGLEHRASTALICSRDDLPRPGVPQITEAYRTFLGLASHEYFHAWNVKRIRPAAFTPYDLERENYTTLLWAFEGITSYYDDLMLVRSGLVSEADYLEMLGRNITSHLRTPGRERQTLADASWDAWIKYYRQDENAPNALVSYYLKGSLVALCLDLHLRSRTRGRRSLDDVMRALWDQYGRSGEGVPEGGIERIASGVTGLRLKPFFDRALRSTGELPFKTLLATAGVSMALRRAESPADRGGRPSAKGPERLAERATLGVRTAGEGLEARLTHVLAGSAAEEAGLAAGDVIVAIDGLRVTARNLDARLDRLRPGERVRVHAFRRDELMAFDATLQVPPADTCVLEMDPRAAAAAKSLRAGWLGGT